MADRHVSAAPPRTPDEAIAVLIDRLRATLSVVDPWAGDAGRGIGPADLHDILARWIDGFDWRRHEQRICDLPWEIVGEGDRALRLIHQRTGEEHAPAVVLLHGWPDSVLRFERVRPLLRDVNVIVPALPGFPFAARHFAPASVNSMADLVAAAVTALGYDRFVLSGGDLGGDIAEVIAGDVPDGVLAMHLTNVSARHVFAVDPGGLAPDARAYIGHAMAWNRLNGGYIAEQSTRPRTLLAALGDSPAGLAAWILEKILAWTDDPAQSFSTDELLTWVSAYWFSGAIGTSFASYAEPAVIPGRTAVPTVASAFRADIKPAPQSYVEAFVDLYEYVPHEVGGHFAAWEQPDAYVADLRRALNLATHPGRGQE
ncbi:epoxide hydrolase family protein [Humibacter ginsengisoli]